VKMFDAGKTRMIWLPYGEKNYDDMLSRFHLILERYGRTDGRTDRRTDGQICYINIAHQHTALLTRDNNMKLVHWLLMGRLLHMVQRGGDWAGLQPA